MPDVDGTMRDTRAIQGELARIAHMFAPHRDDPVMRELCRLAVKCAQERRIRLEVERRGE